MSGEDAERAAREAEGYRVGESLYGLSLHELSARISAHGEEIKRLEAELAKKSTERSAADALFARKDG